ncbi:MAG TPA: sulfur carrier protein ThiS [Planctomycetaceae bacterium]|nr:sulfur carrier protein ThiS [Planctomycetaceae bacterium]
MQITVNGEVMELEDGATIARLLERLELQPRYVAVERNCELVPRTEHDRCVLRPGDRVEIVTLVGGG